MPSICDEVAKLASDIRNLLKEADTMKTYEVMAPGIGKVTRTGKLNQTAVIDINKGKITDIKETPGEWHRTPKGKPVIYTSISAAERSLEPSARDVIELAEHDRPYICHAIRMAGENKVACFIPNGYFKFIKDDLKAIRESEQKLNEIIQRRWGTDKPQTKIEESLRESIEHRRRNLKSLLEPVPEETFIDSYRVRYTIPAKPGFASYAVVKCSFDVK